MPACSQLTPLTGSSFGCVCLSVSVRYIYTSGTSGRGWYKRKNGGVGNWFSVSCSSDGANVLAAQLFDAEDHSGYVNYSPNYGATWFLQDDLGGANWAAVTTSGDGNKVVAAQFYNDTTNPGFIFTGVLTSEYATLAPISVCCMNSCAYCGMAASPGLPLVPKAYKRNKIPQANPSP